MNLKTSSFNETSVKLETSFETINSADQKRNIFKRKTSSASSVKDKEIKAISKIERKNKSVSKVKRIVNTKKKVKLMSRHFRSRDRFEISDMTFVDVVIYDLFSKHKNVKLFVIFFRNIDDQIQKDIKSSIDFKIILSTKFHDLLNVFFETTSDELTLWGYEISVRKDWWWIEKNKREQIASKDREKALCIWKEYSITSVYQFYSRCLIFIWKALYLYKTSISRTSAIKSSFRAFAYFHSHSCHRASKAFFQKCSLSLSHSLLYILTRIIEHRKSSREFCHSKNLDFSLIQNDRIYFITYYFLRFDDRSLIIQQKRCFDVNKTYNQKRWIIWLKKKLNLDSTRVLLMKVLTNEWKSWRKFFWWKFWRKKWYSWRANSCSASRI